MSFHTKKSPSQGKRAVACSGTFAICDALPDIHKNQSGIAAQIGTATHALIERCLKEGSEPEDYRGRIVELVGEDEEASILRKGAKLPGPGRIFFEVDADMIDGAEVMTSGVRARCKELGVDASALQLETRTNPLPDRDDTSGTADVTIDAWPTWLELWDYKNGYNIVETDSIQTDAYLLGKALESDWAYENYRVVICQPNAQHEDGRVRFKDRTKKELLAFQKMYRTALERCDEAEADANAPTNHLEIDPDWAEKYLDAGDGDHCMFCDAKPICPAHLKFMEAAAQTDFDDEPEEIKFNQDEAEVAQRLRWVPVLNQYTAALNLYAQRALEAGYSCGDFKLVMGRSNRKFRDDFDEEKLVRLITKGGFVQDEASLYSRKLITGPAAEKLVAKKRRAKFAEKFLIKPEGSLTVAPGDDPRPAVVRNAGDDFAEFDEEDFG